MNMRKIVAFILVASIAQALSAACNPEPVEIECSRHEAKSCGGVIAPSYGKVLTQANCTNFIFTLQNLVNGKETIFVQEVYTSNSNGPCPESKKLRNEYLDIPAIVTWKAVAGDASYSGGGTNAVVSRTNGVCRAECVFEISCKPSICNAPEPQRISAVAEFSGGAAISQESKPRLCCVSTNHPPHVFHKDGCDISKVIVDPDLAARVVFKNDEIAHILGSQAYEGVHAIAKAACGADTNDFDVVEIRDFLVVSACGCRTAVDSTDSDEDAPIVDTMESGIDTGFEISLPVEPMKWAEDARWKLEEDGWMLREGDFSPGKHKIMRVDSSSLLCTINAWFDCNPDNIRAEDEPKRQVIGTVARLGELVALENPDKNLGKVNACDETFSPGTKVLFTNTGFLPVDRAHKLKVIKTLAADKNRPMTIPVGEIPSAGFNEWQLKIQDDCPDGLFWVELTDPLHSCTSVVKRFCVQQCACITCDKFAKDVLANGCIDISFGLGRTASGGAKAPVRVVLESTEKLPELSSEVAADGRMDVSTTNGVMIVSFTRKDEEIPVAVFTLTPGADVFTLSEIRDGSLRKTARWMLNQGVWTMEVWDETASPAMLVKRDVRMSTITQLGKMERLTSGEQVTETEYAAISEIGLLPIRETRGSGIEARSTYTSYITSGISKGRIHSEVSPDGSWTLYEYDSSNRVKSVTVPFGDASPILDDKKAVVGYNGRVRKTEYFYESLDSRDNGTNLANEPRTTVEKIGSDTLGWEEVSRTYAAYFIEGNIRTEISERAHSPQATYGAEGNQRTISQYHINTQGAGRPIRRETPDGFVTMWAYEFTPSNVVIETMTVPVLATNGIPFKTTIERSIEDLRGDVLREETYVLTDAGKELLSWVEYERDTAGHELKRISSNGGLTERAWSCCGPEWEKDERGIITDYSYDALGRQVTTTRNGITTFRVYDLLGNVTNETRFAGSLFVSSSTGYDSVGRLVWSVGEDGARTEHKYSTSPEGGEVRTTIQATGTDCALTNTVVSFRDGSTKATYLNGVLKTTEVHEPFASLIYEGTNGIASARWSRSESDFLGRPVAQSHPGFGGSTLVTSNYYDSVGRLISTLSLSTQSTRSTRLNSQLYFYNELNERIATIDDRNFNETIDWTGPDLISSNLTHYVKLNGDWWRETRQWSIHDDNSAEARLMNVSRSRITGLGVDNLSSESVTIDQRGNETLSRTIRNRDVAEEIAWTKYPTSTTPVVTVSTNGLIYSSTSQTGVITTFGYDALQRQIAQTDGRGNTVRTIYDNLGRVASAIDALGYSITYGYDALGRQISVTDPLTNTVTTTYDAEGRIISQRGATYPVDYSYDDFGDKVSMTTYRDFNGERGMGNGEPGAGNGSIQGDVTRWLRDEATGLVTNKVYADGKGPRYTYTPEGKLATRTWARGIVTTYSYDANGAMTNTVYSDSTPSITFAYNRAGRQVRAEDAAGVTTFLYDEFGAVTNETVVGVAGTNVIERFYDSLGRALGYSLNGVRQSTLTYDPETSRLATMLANGSEVPFKWNYLNGSDLKSSLDYPNGLTATWDYDANNKLIQVRNAFPTNTISQYNYIYDAAGRRVRITCSGSAMSETRTDVYGYNIRNELISAVKMIGGDDLGAQQIATTEYAYEYDDIGNRKTSFDLGTNRTYIANSLNQYTSISNSALSASPREEFVPQFDDDGNQTLIQTATGIWQVQYNGENRPVLWKCVSTNSHIPNSSSPSLISMSYDRMGRRITKNAQRFVYDGYLQIFNFEFAMTNSQLATHSFQLFTWDPTETVATRTLVWNRGASATYYTYDGNKNVSDVVSFIDASSALHYKYGPFGDHELQVGESSFQNPWRFSCEFADDDLALSYYNYRHYDHVCGRWFRKDPYEDDYSPNLYAFCANNCNLFDKLGLWLSYRHRKLTSRAFWHGSRTVFKNECGACYSQYDLDRIEEALVKANVDTDSGDKADDQGYHFCSWTKDMDYVNYTKRYSSYLTTKLKDYTSSLELPRVDCKEALEHLGILSHMWQDYYAHGVEKDDSWFGATIGKIKGSPEDIQMIPVSFGGEGFRGGHGGLFRLANAFSRVEPGDRANDSGKRRNLAKWFTIGKFKELLPTWADACRCDKTWKKEGK